MSFTKKIKIPYVSLGRNWSSDKNLILKKISKFLDKGDFVGGQEIINFEKNISKICNVKHTVGMNSGTDALTIGLHLLGVKRGDEVITPANSFISSTSSIIHLGANPIFTDVNDDLNINPYEIEKKITKKTKAIMPVHLTGRIADMRQIMKISKKYKIPIIEDAAQAIGSKYYGKKSGSFGKVACFSAHPLKNLSAVGDSGYLTTNDKNIFKKAKLLINHGIEKNNKVNHFGYVSRLDNLQALLLNHNLKKLNNIIKIRRRNAKIYNSELKEVVKVPLEKKYEYNTYHTYIIQTSKRAKLMRFLRNNGVETKIHYPVSIHLQKAYKKHMFKKQSLPNTEKLSKKILTLPINQHLEENKIYEIVDLIRKFFRK